jgi:hypothetical protein
MTDAEAGLSRPDPAMRRLHLLEIEDQPWCPAPVRDAATDYLRSLAAGLRPYQPLVPRLAAALERTGSSRIIDLCAGGGGPWPELLPAVRAALDGRPLDVRLTDRYPNREAWERIEAESHGAIRGVPEPVDALRVPRDLTGFRTLFNGFHHFEPDAARRILVDAVERGEGIGVFELVERAPRALLTMPLMPLFVLLATPFIRPVRGSRLFWTYVLPAVPLVTFVDGIVSCLRTYTTRELEAMTAALRSYRWEIGQERIGRLRLPVSYAIGCPSAPRK